MPDHHQILMLLGLVVVASPLVLTILLGVSSLLDWKLAEETTTTMVFAAVSSGLVAAVAVLVAFFQERPAPARNGLWVWTVYRVSDAALLLAAVVMHHLRGEGDFDKLLGAGPWPEEHSIVPVGQALLVGLLLLAAAAGKS